MNVNDLTFGIEIETTLPAGCGVQVGTYRVGIQIPGLPAGWVAKHDGSIREGRGRYGAEIVSPVLRGEEGARQLPQVCAWLRQIGAKVNDSCGCHVHVGWTGDEAALARLVHLAANHEKAFYAATGTKRRERGAYCQPVRSSPDYQARFVQGTDRPIMGRYYLLNLQNLAPGSRKRTVEFRCFSATTNFRKICGYIRLCLGLVQKAHDTKRQTQWANKAPVATSPIHRDGGEGQTELTRLFYALGWTKGRVPTVFGDLAPSELPSLKATKRELMRLAKQYDAQQR